MAAVIGGIIGSLLTRWMLDLGRATLAELLESGRRDEPNGWHPSHGRPAPFAAEPEIPIGDVEPFPRPRRLRP
jgi:hypothetical protein